MLERESRAGKYGRYLAVWIKYTISQQSDTGYQERFLDELKRYSFRKRRKGESRNKGCVLELTDIPDMKVENPEHLARLVKEGIHLLYQKDTARRVLGSLISSL